MSRSAGHARERIRQRANGWSRKRILAEIRAHNYARLCDLTKTRSLLMVTHSSKPPAYVVWSRKGSHIVTVLTAEMYVLPCGAAFPVKINTISHERKGNVNKQMGTNGTPNTSSPFPQNGCEQN